MRQVHLNKNGSGITSKTACGRNVMRTPISMNWNEFKNVAEEHQCAKCAESRQAVLNAKADADQWEPEDSEAWKKSDDALIAKNKKY